MRTLKAWKEKYSQLAGFKAVYRSSMRIGAPVVIYLAKEQGFDVGGDRYAVVCEAHATLTSDTSLEGARKSARHSANFCEACKAAA